MLTREDYIKRISYRLAYLQTEIRLRGLINLYDGHVIAEDFVAGLLNLIFGYKLQNLNYIHKNQPGIDLGDSDNGIAVQVTADKSKRKIQTTIAKFVAKDLHKEYPRLDFFILLEKQKRYSSFDTGDSFSFDSRNILDFGDLITKINTLHTEELKEIAKFLDREVSTPDDSSSSDLLLLRGLLDEFPVIKDIDFYHPNFQRWHNTVKQYLLQIFGEDSHQVKEYNKIAWHTSDEPGDADKQKELYLRSCIAAEGQLGSAIRVLENLAPATTEKTQEERVYEAELLLAFYKWWGSIKDYETSGAEMTGSASESGLVPRSPEMGTQLGNFEVVKIKTWPFLSEKTRQIVEETEQVFLGFLARVYGGFWNHEVYGDLVPKEVMRNDRIEEMIFRRRCTYTFSECKQAYRKLRAEIEK